MGKITLITEMQKKFVKKFMETVCLSYVLQENLVDGNSIKQ